MDHNSIHNINLYNLFFQLAESKLNPYEVIRWESIKLITHKLRESVKNNLAKIAKLEKAQNKQVAYLNQFTNAKR